jgi:hypothetical protein
VSGSPKDLSDGVQVTDDGIYLALKANVGGPAETGPVYIDHSALAGLIRYAVEQKFVETRDIRALADLLDREAL